ncbi:MAG: ribonuclease III [Candidatus Zixiibacteriota bacterium]|nr:MAG: ribonuclease III [candidate division Zixibacteria bacterium]
MKLVEDFHQKLGYRFSKESHLLEALTHRSYVRTINHDSRSNERLEFLGDSILGMVISEHLLQKNPDNDEGELTKAKALLVNETTLAAVAQESGLNQFILLSVDEERTGGRDRTSIMSDAVEAIIGAIYLDGGLQPAKEFIRRLLIFREKQILNDAAQRNYKGELLEYLQARGGGPPHYDVISEEGPDHDKTFTVAVYTNGEMTGTGTGSTKKEAEQQAAAVSLERLMASDAEKR